jgi:hypothetical protein
MVAFATHVVLLSLGVQITQLPLAVGIPPGWQLSSQLPWELGL